MIARQTVAVTWALHARGITPTAWKVLMVLAHMVNNKRGDWNMWPKQQTLADSCELTLSTLKRHLDELEDKGFVIRCKRMRAGGGYAGCLYTLNVVASFTSSGMTFDYNFAEEDEDEPLGQIELARSLTPDLSRSLTADLAIEPLNLEPLNREQPLSPTEKAPLGEKGDSDSGQQLALLSEAVAIGEKEERLSEWVLRRYNDLASRIPGIAAMRFMTPIREKKIDSTKRESLAGLAKQAGLAPRDAWEQIFEAIEQSTFLRGEAAPGRNRDDPFRLTFDFLLQPTQFTKILEGGYNANRNASTHNLATGRRYGPAEQAGREILGRILADGDEPGERDGAREGAGADDPGRPPHGRLRSAFDRFGDDFAGICGEDGDPE